MRCGSGSLIPCAAGLGLACSLVGGAKAAITISDFTLSTDTVSFTIAGTLPLSSPAANAQSIYFLNSITVSPGEGFVKDVALEAPLSHTSTIAPPLLDAFPMFTGNPIFGDYFGTLFEIPLSPGQAMGGSVSATFAADTFNPAEVTSILVIWGDDGSAIEEGVLLTTIAVPEVSTTLLLGVAGLAFCQRRRRGPTSGA